MFCLCTYLQSLVEQVEGGGSNLESELVKETEVLLQEFKAHESVENQLRVDLAESHAHLTGTKEQVAVLTEENEALTKQVLESDIHTCMYKATFLFM